MNPSGYIEIERLKPRPQLKLLRHINYVNNRSIVSSKGPSEASSPYNIINNRNDDSLSLTNNSFTLNNKVKFVVTSSID